MTRSRSHMRLPARALSEDRQSPEVAPPTVEAMPVIGIGASADGLDACTRFLDALPAANGMAFILVQHLDATHERGVVELLASHTAMTVRQAADGMPVERDHLYVIPPGAALSVADGLLRLSPPQALSGASQIAGLTARQREVMDMVLAGHPSKNIAADLGISQRTVENHRAEIMKKTGARSLPALARLAIAGQT